jgi:hypothetical protein
MENEVVMCLCACVGGWVGVRLFLKATVQISSTMKCTGEAPQSLPMEYADVFLAHGWRT